MQLRPLALSWNQDFPAGARRSMSGLTRGRPPEVPSVASRVRRNDAQRHPRADHGQVRRRAFAAVRVHSRVRVASVPEMRSVGVVAGGQERGLPVVGLTGSRAPSWGKLCQVIPRTSLIFPAAKG